MSAHFHIHGDFFAVHHAAGANGQNFGYHGLFLGAAGEDDAALGGLLRLNALEYDSVQQGFEIHNIASYFAYLVL